MKDEWFFEIGDGRVYGPFPLETLQKWAHSGDLMPTHRVRHVDSTDWVIAAYVTGLEDTTRFVPAEGEPVPEAPSTFRSRLGGMVGLGRGKAKSKVDPKSVESDTSGGPGKETSTVAASPAVTSPVKPVSGTPTPAKPTPGASIPAKATSIKVIDVCNEILETAVRRNASDIHVDPFEAMTLVQLRIDGQLETFKKLPATAHPVVVGRFKVLANMDIAEHRVPQDGRFRFAAGEQRRRIDIRVACLPTTHGERLTLRLLAVETEQLTINRLGMSPPTHSALTTAMAFRQGLILVTGPTGSGKSTTLYAAIRHYLAHYPGKIITIEDPVEFDIVGVSQVEISTSDTVRFSAALRNILRSDPDAIMIGEIRDHESADIAIKAALTGHLVFSSLHANSAASTITRLVDIGIPRYLVAATLRLSMAQRLIRRLCPACRKPRPLTAAEANDAGRPQAASATVYEPGNCAQCGGRGYRGRTGVFEVLPIQGPIAARISAGCDEAEIQTLQHGLNLESLADDGFSKVLAGVTSYSDWLAAGLR